MSKQAGDDSVAKLLLGGSDAGNGDRRLQQDLEAMAHEIGALRTVLSDQNIDQRLGNLEQTTHAVAQGTETVIETVRNFEAIISVGMIQRLNDLIEQRLTVIANVTEEVRRARRHRRLWTFCSALLAGLLLAEVYSNGASSLFAVAGGSLLAFFSGLVTWSQALIDA